ncbi:hypothetical protein [Tahibacter aquaticus]|uniref:hypothetical protein n=1 Tax=Tahibacter aquaticus TaxID=520092 RepID=UPI00141518BF|nr:hypothetical protein [Tahibacter aquaticus]
MRQSNTLPRAGVIGSVEPGRFFDWTDRQLDRLRPHPNLAADRSHDPPPGPER